MGTGGVASPALVATSLLLYQMLKYRNATCTNACPEPLSTRRTRIAAYFLVAARHRVQMPKKMIAVPIIFGGEMTRMARFEGSMKVR